MKHDRNKKQERSVFQVFLSTYGLFIRKRPKQYFIMVLLSLLPALLSPVKVYLEKNIFEGLEHLHNSGVLINSNLHRLILYAAIAQFLYFIVYPVFRCHSNYFGSDFETILQEQLNKKTRKIALQIYEDPALYQSIKLACSTSRELRFMTVMFSSELLLYVFQFIFVVAILGIFHPLLMILGIAAIMPDIFLSIFNL